MNTKEMSKKVVSWFNPQSDRSKHDSSHDESIDERNRRSKSQSIWKAFHKRSKTDNHNQVSSPIPDAESFKMVSEYLENPFMQQSIKKKDKSKKKMTKKNKKSSSMAFNTFDWWWAFTRIENRDKNEVPQITYLRSSSVCNNMPRLSKQNWTQDVSEQSSFINSALQNNLG